jgi:hypothetical protein
MKSFSLLFAIYSLFFTVTAHAQWQTTTYSLKGGWSAIYLTGDATQDTIGNLFPATVTEVWRWNTNPNQVQFIESPQVPTGGTPEWSVWKRDFPAQSTFSELTGQTAYLVKSSGTTANTYTVAIKQSPLPPRLAWVRNGANLLGFPTFKDDANGSTFPLFSDYFSTFPAAIAANTKVFKYIGGEMGAGNPLHVFSPSGEPLDRSQAYWFSSEVVSDFHSPLAISLSNSAGLDFGRSGSIITVRIRNRSATAINLTLSREASESVPSGQPAVTAVPLTRRVFNPATVRIEPQDFTSFVESIPGSSTVELQFGIDRGSMTGDLNSRFASFLRLTDNTLMDIWLPVRAQNTSLVGLWAGDIKVTAVESKVAGSPGTTTPEPFKLRTLLHVETGGTARLLSQVFLGQLAVAPNDVGLCTLESLLKQDTKAQAQRMVATHLSLDQVITAGSGSVVLPGTLEFEVKVPYNDPTNPFLHQYHPDHDNRDALFVPFVLPGGVTPNTAKISDGVEAPAISRTCTFTFTTTPPAGSDVTSGWGSSVLGGTYTETISGIHKETINVSGTFELQRASEVGTLSQ